ncbi:hypothetical protein ABGV40_14865 [Paenibacillus amylolyticus]|uniref:hypothetical protein n=1 Tax=Paenibacillus amylolyticus TaxID=1451 RepID=UPI0032427D8D
MSATLVPTGQEGENNGTNHIEYEMLDGQGGRVSLASDDVEYIKRNGTTLTPDDQETLWFNEETAPGTYVFEAKTISGKIYRATLIWSP